jgi:ornithine cyclodeaminase/alanine dehydrogenase-like protein (mu-crystallin family)
VKTTVYSLDDVRTIVRKVGLNRIMDDAIHALHDACATYNPDAHVVPVRDGFEYDQPHLGLIEWMPAMKHGHEVIIKVVGYHPENPATHALPTILSTALCFDTRNGHLLAVMDGNFLTAVRTGAASAVASRILAAPESQVLGLIGCGAQSISQLHALSRVFDLQQVMVFDTDQDAAASFSRRSAYLDLPDVEIVSAPLEQVATGADILCTATSVAIGAGPVFSDRLLQPWVHVNAVGSDFPGKTEVPLSLLERSLVCPDFLPQAVHEGECQQLSSPDIGPDLLQLVQQAENFQQHQAGTTVFDSTGWAMEDYVTMNLLMNFGRELGCGTELSLANVSADPHNPYAMLGAEPHQDRGAAESRQRAQARVHPARAKS